MIIITKKGYQLFLKFCIILIQLWITLNAEKAFVFSTSILRGWWNSRKTTKPLFIHFWWNWAFFLADCQSLAAAILRGPDSKAAGKRWEWGNFLTTKVRPWAWVLQWGRVGTGVFLITHFTKPAFKCPGDSWNRSLLPNRDSSCTWILWCLVQLKNCV